MKEVLNENRHFFKQILKLSKSELIKTYKGAALGPGMGSNKTGNYDIRILVRLCNRLKGRQTDIIQRCYGRFLSISHGRYDPLVFHE